MNRPHTLGSRLAASLLRRLGWTPMLDLCSASGHAPKQVVAFAPHTHNDDFWIGLLWVWACRVPVKFVAKQELFRGVMGTFMRAVGGLSLDRRQAGGNFVGAVADLIGQQTEIALAVAPEGRRAYTPHWKTGFYYMALQAGVPISVGVFDWGRKRVGIVGQVTPTGHIEADFAAIRALLSGVQGRVPAHQGPVEPRPTSIPAAA